jgi:hypothetical protein
MEIFNIEVAANAKQVFQKMIPLVGIIVITIAIMVIKWKSGRGK